MSKSSIPYFQFYPTDFMHGVRGLSAQEVGVYTMLLCRIYEENGPVEHHNLRLATYCNMREATFKKTLSRLIDLGKIQVENGFLSNRRSEEEISDRSDKLKNKSTAGKASAAKRQQKQGRPPTDVEQTGIYTDTDTDTDKKVTKVTKKDTRILDVLCGVVSVESAESFIAYRSRHRRHGILTETAAKRLMTKLTEIQSKGGDPDDALALAEERSWASVEVDWYFKTKNGNTNGTSTGQADTQRFVDQNADAARIAIARATGGAEA